MTETHYETLPLVLGSLNPIEMRIQMNDGLGADYDWTAAAKFVQAQLKGVAVNETAWEAGATGYTVQEQRWLRAEGALLSTMRNAAGLYVVYYKVAGIVEIGCFVRVR